MRWTSYAAAMLWFSAAGFVAVYLLQRFQTLLPLNPQALGPVTPDSSFNTAVSFATNTNWQGYGGETTMSDLTQMLGLNVQNFVSAAAGMAVLVALIRGLSRRRSTRSATSGSTSCAPRFTSCCRSRSCCRYYLSRRGSCRRSHPIKTFRCCKRPATSNLSWTKTGGRKDADDNPIMETVSVAEQTLPMGPAASQIAIKQLGTNGGGFFNVNSSHPLENPTPVSNLLEMLSILLISAALCHTFGAMVGDTRQGWALLAAMTIVFVALTIPCMLLEQRGTPQLAELGADLAASGQQAGGNMEGKEARFGVVNSALWATATTAASNGSVNSMHDSYTPLAGAAPMWLMQLGEVIFGGVGSGLYGMLLFAIVAVFIAGLMVGRTPEYLGKKIEAYEMKMAAIGILVPCAAVLIGTAVAVVTPQGKATIFNPSTHGFSEVLYAFSSAGNNNGSAFAGLGANTPFYNTMLGLAMLFARFWVMVPALAIAGSLAKKKIVPVGAGTMPTHTPLFVTLLIAVVILVGALTFIPALALGPIAEQLIMTAQ